ncbi:sodium channel subunit beta-3-like [Oreochromis aureus]|uniref:sodium channel subunit beta-3-like n=1 Tax=Oreochromis aureus TaxID=47969 RepID=UPI0012BD27A5|nr:sodium channel subunit beta-3-like [Oreochromis aureus]
MAAVRLLLFLPLASISAALQLGLQAKLGDDVTLHCQITTDERISVLKWSRADLNTDGYVYFYRNKRSYENYQHSSFHGRVKLRDPEMKDGDVSLILKNVTFNDTGMYECHVAVRNPGRSKRVHTKISHFINLTVTGETHENMHERHIVEREDGSGNMYDMQQAGNPPVLMFAGVTAIIIVIIVVPAFLLFVLLLKIIRNKKLAVPPNQEATGLKC